MKSTIPAIYTLNNRSTFLLENLLVGRIATPTNLHIPNMTRTPSTKRNLADDPVETLQPTHFKHVPT